MPKDLESISEDMILPLTAELIATKRSSIFGIHRTDISNQNANLNVVHGIGNTIHNHNPVTTIVYRGLQKDSVCST